MKTIRLKTVGRLLGFCAGVLAAGGAFAQPYTVSTNYTIGLGIPDNNPSGLASTETFSAPGISQITDLSVTLNISGGYNGDYYAYLEDASGFAVLLNRVGKDGGNPLGYADSGLNVTLKDSAPNGDIHVYQLTLNPGGGALTGTWAPDGRVIDPSLVTTASPRTATLGSFDGSDPNASFTLFVADLDPGSTGVLQSWGLSVTGVPEPATTALFLTGCAGMLLWRRLARRK